MCGWSWVSVLCDQLLSCDRRVSTFSLFCSTWSVSSGSGFLDPVGCRTRSLPSVEVTCVTRPEGWASDLNFLAARSLCCSDIERHCCGVTKYCWYVGASLYSPTPNNARRSSISCALTSDSMVLMSLKVLSSSLLPHSRIPWSSRVKFG